MRLVACGFPRPNLDAGPYRGWHAACNERKNALFWLTGRKIAALDVNSRYAWADAANIVCRRLANSGRRVQFLRRSGPTEVLARSGRYWKQWETRATTGWYCATANESTKVAAADGCRGNGTVFGWEVGNVRWHSRGESLQGFHAC